MTDLTRRTLLGAGAALLTAPAIAAPDLAALTRAAAAESGDLTWYESNRLDALDRIATAFSRGPGTRIRVRPESIPGGTATPGRIANERAAGGRTADVVTTGSSGILRLVERNLLEPTDWAGMGFPADWIAGPALLTAVAMYGVVYNTRLVPEDTVPRRWEDLLDPRWSGKIGTWVRAAAFAELASAWGEARTTEFYEAFLRQRPMLFKSTAPLAQQVAAGEVTLGLGIFHTAQPAIRRGAPIGVSLLDPTPVSAVWTAAVAGTRRPNAARLLGAWLATPDGARAYEAQTDRGHPRIPETETGARVGRLTLAEWPMDRKDEYARIYEAYNARVNESEAR